MKEGTTPLVARTAVVWAFSVCVWCSAYGRHQISNALHRTKIMVLLKKHIPCVTECYKAFVADILKMKSDSNHDKVQQSVVSDILKGAKKRMLKQMGSMRLT
jgi:hypothetical protein